MSDVPGGPIPQISVVIPLYNKRDTIARTVESVRRQIGVTAEIIIVDDGSTDGSAAVVDGLHVPGLRLVRQDNAGPGRARNVGTEQARADLVAYLDADDEWKPGYLAAALAAFERHPDCVAYVCGYDSGAFAQARPNLVRALGLTEGRHEVPLEGDGMTLALRLNAVHSSCTVVRRSVFRRFGGFYEHDRCLYGEDSYFWIQVLFAGPIYWDPAERILFHVEDSDLGFAVTHRSIARPVSLHPDALLRNIATEFHAPLTRTIRACAEYDGYVLCASGHPMKAVELFASHDLLRPRILRRAARRFVGHLLRRHLRLDRLGLLRPARL